MGIGLIDFYPTDEDEVNLFRLEAKGDICASSF